MRPQTRFQAIRTGFTIVELLVVITIITIMIAMLLPAVSKAREATYVTLCLQNMHQVGIGIGVYGADFFDRVAPNCTRIDGYTPWLNPYEQLTNPAGGGYRTFLAAPSHPQGFIRMDMDYATLPDFQWTSGLGVMWRTGAIPFTLGGARALWCPGERRADFKNSSPNSTIVGPGTYFDKVSQYPDRNIPGFNGGPSVQSNYIYRSLGVDPNFYTINQGPSKGSWRLSAMAPFTAVVDMAINIYYNPSASFKPAFTHGGVTYAGINKLNYDGHAKWFNDPNATWVSANGGDSTSGNTVITAQWNLYDAAN